MKPTKNIIKIEKRGRNKFGVFCKILVYKVGGGISECSFESEEITFPERLEKLFRDTYLLYDNYEGRRLDIEGISLKDAMKYLEQNKRKQ